MYALFISLRGEIPTKQRIVDTLALLDSQSDQSGSLDKISKSLEDTGTRQRYSHNTKDRSQIESTLKILSATRKDTYLKKNMPMCLKIF